MIFLQRNGFFAFFQRLTSLFVIPHLFLVALGILLVLLFFLITANVRNNDVPTFWEAWTMLLLLAACLLIFFSFWIIQKATKINIP
jgi:protein-S-isoprenylcysteine O-methyltransferase Ste14